MPIVPGPRFTPPGCAAWKAAPLLDVTGLNALSIPPPVGVVEATVPDRAVGPPLFMIDIAAELTPTVR